MKKSLFFSLLIIFSLVAGAIAQNQTEADQPPENLEVEAVLCTGIEDRMPTGENTAFPADVEKVYLWTRVSGVTEGEMTIHHVWLRNGKEMADVPLKVKGSPWRTYSYKTIPAEWAGKWEAKVVGPDGNVIKSLAFTVGETDEEKPEEKQ